MARKHRLVPMIFLGLLVLLLSFSSGLETVRHHKTVEALSDAPVPTGVELRVLQFDLRRLEAEQLTLSLIGTLLVLSALLACFYPGSGKGDKLHGRRKEILVGSLFLAILIPLGNLVAHGWIVLAGPRGITPTMVATIEDFLRQGKTACGVAVLLPFLLLEVFNTNRGITHRPYKGEQQ